MDNERGAGDFSVQILIQLPFECVCLRVRVYIFFLLRLCSKTPPPRRAKTYPEKAARALLSTFPRTRRVPGRERGMEGAMPAAASHRKRHTSRRTHTSRAAIRDADSDRARPSPLDRIHTPEGITLQHREMGPIQLTNHFITESGELRLLIMVPEDSSGSVGVKVSNTTHRVERLPADGTAAAGGLLRIGDRVISVDGTLLGETKLLDAINVSVREHALIVHRAATDLRAVNGLKQLPEAALAGCHLAQLLRANLGSTRLAGKRTQLGLSVNKNNGIDYVVPGSVAAFEGTLCTNTLALGLAVWRHITIILELGYGHG